jgi:hypothetical protein
MKENLDAVKSVIEAIASSVWVIIITIIVLTCCWITTIYLCAPIFGSGLTALNRVSL